ncbi:MAG: acetyltransferase [Anaerolineae bacterium]
MIYVIGDGGLGREVKCYIESTGEIAELVGPQSRLSDDDLLAMAQPDVVIAVGDPALRRELARKFAGRVVFKNIFAGSVQRHSIRRLGRGCVFAPGVRLTTGIEIGNHIHFNLNVTVGHDTIIHDYCVINPGANISGRVTLGEGVLVGTGACIRDGVSVGKNAVIGMGAVVVKNVPAGMTVAGNPARELRRG